MAALVEKSMQAMRKKLRTEPVLLLTGGASDRLERLIESPLRNVPDLVLRGLAVLAAEASAAQSDAL